MSRRTENDEMLKKPHSERTVLDDISKSIAIIADSIHERQSWTPCTERLPKDSDIVLIWNEWRDRDGFMCAGYALAICSNKRWTGYNNVIMGDVIAWMPLPKPYEKGDE